MAIALRGVSAVAAATSTGGALVTLQSAFPAGWQPGDISILVAPNWLYTSSVAFAGSNATPDGWNLLWSQGATYVFWRRLEEGDLAPAFTVRSGGAQSGLGKAVHVVYSGASTAANPFGPLSTTTGGSVAVNVPAYTMSAAGVAFNLLVGGYSPAFTTLAGTTELFDTAGPPITGPGALALDAVTLAAGATRAAGTCQTDAVNRTGRSVSQTSFSLLEDASASPPPPPTTFLVNQGGTWKPVQSLWVNQGGAWKQVQQLHTNSGGTWKRVL